MSAARIPRSLGEMEGGRPQDARSKGPTERGSSIPLRLDGNEGYRLLVSGSGSVSGGGVFGFDGSAVEQIDEHSTGALAVADGQVVRCIQPVHEPASAPGLYLYDERGVRTYTRLIEILENRRSIPDVHDVLWSEDAVVVVSSEMNAVYWLDPAGRVLRIWEAPGEPDSWHLNGLYEWNGRLLVTAFGRYERFRDWAERIGEPDGVVFDLETGETVVGELCCPHDLRVLDEAFLVCNSATSEVLRIEKESGDVLERVQLEGWTRGLTWCDDFVFVGESQYRHVPKESTATIAVIDRRTLELVKRFHVPCEEVGDVIVVPAALAEGVRRGVDWHAFGGRGEANALASERSRELWTGDELPPEACDVHIEVRAKPEMACDKLYELHCIIENASKSVLASKGPYPVVVGHRWIRSEESGWGIEGIRNELPHLIGPGQRVTVRLRVRAPAEEGSYQLRVTLVQEHVRWFDTVDEDNASISTVRVAGAS